ncbi:hypothetical protein [Spiroplasma endosymbiont of Acasis viretata]|uniref:hypothetical protein n=1 Tax=Spiroplasma endosymbiont of Acasis viretata TaxID=3066306 RepID=UPI00313AC563
MNDLLINNTSELVTFNTNSTDPTNIKNITWKNSIQEYKNKVEQTYQNFLKSQEWGKKLRQQITTPLTTTKNKNRHKKRSTNILVSTLTTEQIQRLSTKQIKWLTNWQIKTFTAEQIKSFTLQQIQALTSEQIPALMPHQIEQFTFWQISAFTTEQIQVLTEKQIQALLPEQIQSFTSEQIPAFTKEQIELFTKEQKEVFWPKQVITKINTMDSQNQSTTTEFKPNLPKM